MTVALAPGREVTVPGIGRCRVHRVVAGSHVDVVDPRNGGIRSVRPDRIRTVHRTTRTREAAR